MSVGVFVVDCFDLVVFVVDCFDLVVFVVDCFDLLYLLLTVLTWLYLQGMTIRTARLPGAGNLLGRAGKNISGLPDRASRYQFCFISFFICFY